MNTPAHVAINLVCLGRKDQLPVLIPVIIGALLPDIFIFLFYFVEKAILGTPEVVIWREAYYQPAWQTIFAIFNSIPLILGGLAIAIWIRSRIGLLITASMGLHVLEDLPLHNDDAHRHFFPLSNWRFISPLSYWDPDHYGGVITILEILAVLVSCVVLNRVYTSWFGRGIIALIAVLYALYFVYVFTVWV